MRLLGIAILSISSIAAAQARPARTISTIFGGPTVLFQSTAGATVKIGNSSVAVGISEPGDYAVVEATGTVALCGRNASGAGVLVTLVKGANGSWSLKGTYALPAADFSGVTYEDNKLWLLDCENRKILSAAYSPGDAPPAVWATAANQTQVPQLASSKELTLVGGGTSGQSVSVWMVPFRRLMADRHKVTFGGAGGPVVTSKVGMEGRQVSLTSSVLRPGDTSLPIKGPPGANVDVLRMDVSPAQVLTTLTLSASGDGIAIVPPLVMGHVYGAKNHGLGAASAPFITPQKRWGVAASLPNGVAIRPFEPMGLWLYVGSGGFRVPLWLDIVDEAQAVVPKSYSAILVIGQEGIDQIIDTPQGKVLLAPTALGTTAILYKAGEPGIASVNLPVPNDPGLAGAVMLFQWWVVVGPGDVRVSDIAGVCVRAAPWYPPGSEVFFGPDVPAKSRVATQVRQPRRTKKSIAQWLSGLKSESRGILKQRRLGLKEIKLLLAALRSKRK